jgi:hypothetical protein
MKTELVLVDDDKILLLVLEKMMRIVKTDLHLSSYGSGKNALDYLSGQVSTENPR